MRQLNDFLIIFVFLLLALPSLAKVDVLPISPDEIPNNQVVDETTRLNVLARLFQTPLHFVANCGQFPEEVVYYAKSEGTTVYCTEQGLTFGFAEGSISLKFSSDKCIKPEAQGELKGKVNYFIGNDPTSWQTDIPTFKEVVYREVYPGIDLVYSGDQRRLKYTFYLQPNSEPDQILMIYDGIESLWVDEKTGELVIQTEWGIMRDAKPIAYQEIDCVRKEVDVSFRLIDEKRVGFAFGDYDPNFMLTLDPGYSTYLGGSGYDGGGYTSLNIALDGSGYIYVAGTTTSTDFPVTPNAYQTALQGGADVFVTKLDPTKSGTASLLYSTYLGGSNQDSGYGIAVGNAGTFYVTGQTLSTDFPITPNAYQPTFQGGQDDGFVTKFASSGSSLLYSTYLGGTGNDYGHGIAVDSLGNAYVTGPTQAGDFPTLNPYQTHQGDHDAFVAKLDTSQSGTASLLYSTYLGGSGRDYGGHSIAVDGSGNVYVIGETDSSNFPTLNPYQADQGGRDAFVTKLNPFHSGLASLLYSTYMGGDSEDYGTSIAVDSVGNAYVTGATQSSDFPTLNPFQDSFGGGDSDVFVASFSICTAPLVNRALSLDGDGDYASVNSPQYNTPDALTVEAWVKSAASSGLHGIISNHANGADNDSSWVLSVSGISSVNLRMYPSGADYEQSSSSGIPVGSWHHIAVTWDGSASTISFYIDGSFVSSAEGPGSIGTTNANLGIGQYHVDNPANQYWFNGLIDEVRIWNRALSQSEIYATMYSPLKGNENGLVGYWQFDEAPGSTIAHDSSVNGNHGTLYGDANFVPPDTPIINTGAHVSIQNSQGSPGATVLVPVIVENVIGIGSIDLTINYDADVLTPGDAQTTDLTVDWEIDSYVVAPGTINVGTTHYTQPASDGALIKIPFTVSPDAQQGDYALTLAEARINEGNIDSHLTSGIFEVIEALPPVINSISPTSGVIGTQVTISGSNFGEEQSDSTVTFNDIDAGAADSWTNTEIKVKVPAGATAGSVVVTVNSQSSNNDKVFTVFQALVVNAGDDKNICHPNNGGEANIGGNPTAKGGTPPYTYNWIPTTGLDDVSVANPTATPNETTTYTVTATDSSGTPQEVSDSVTVTVHPELIANAGEDKAIGQEIGGEPTASGGTPNSGDLGYTYSWTPTTGLDDSNIANPTASPSEMTTYTVTVTDDNGCQDTDEMTVSHIIESVTASPTTPVGIGGKITVTAIGGDEKQSMFDDGTNGDEVASDSIYSYEVTTDCSMPHASTNKLAACSTAASASDVPCKTYQLPITATDIAGNDKSIDVELTICFGPPVAEIDYPAENACLRGEVCIIGTAQGGSEVLNSWILRIEPKGGQVSAIGTGTEPVSNATLKCWDTTKKADGDYTLKLTVYTGESHNETVDTVTVTVDNTPPQPTITIGENNYTKSNTSSSVSGETEAGSSVVSAMLIGLGETQSDIKDVTSDITIDATGKISGMFTVGDLSNYSGIKVKLCLRDCPGNKGCGFSNSLTVDDELPTVRILTPANCAYFNRLPIHIAGSAQDKISGVAEVKINGVYSAELFPVDDTTTNWTFNFSPGGQGVYIIRASVYDNAGNFFSSTNTIKITYFIGLPAANLISPSDNSEVSCIVNVYGLVDDADADPSDMEWELRAMPGTVDDTCLEEPCTGAVIASGNTPVYEGLLTRWDTRNLLQGAYTLCLTVKNELTSVHVRRTNITVVRKEICYGDVNEDGKITAEDASLVLKAVVGLVTLSEKQKQAADVTGDGNVTALDAATILQYTVGIIPTLPLQKID